MRCPFLEWTLGCRDPTGTTGDIDYEIQSGSQLEAVKAKFPNFDNYTVKRGRSCSSERHTAAFQSHGEQCPQLTLK